MSNFNIGALRQLPPATFFADFRNGYTNEMVRLNTTRSTTVSTRVNNSGLIETVGANIPRLDYDPVTKAVKGLLVEPAATNYDTSSSAINWTVINTTVSADQTTAPDGVASTADSVLETAVTDVHTVYKDYTLSAGSYVFSCFVKSIGGRNFQLNPQQLGGGGSGGGIVQFDLSTGTVISGTGTITEIGNGWYRVSGSAVTAGATGMRVIAYSIDGTSTSFAGDITKGIYMWGMQVEAGPIATSYIPTTTGGVTRNADDISISSASGLIGQTEGTLYVEVDPRNASGITQDILYISNNNYTNRIYINLGTAGEVRAEGNNILITGGGSTGIAKIALGYADNNSNLFVNGSQVGTTDTTCTILSGKTDIDIGQSWAASNQANMWIRSVALFKKRLTDQQLRALTGN